jgi:hypothetical protein
MITEVYEGLFEGTKLVAAWYAPQCYPFNLPDCSKGHAVSIPVGAPYSIAGTKKGTGDPWSYEYANIGPAAGHISNANCVGSNSCQGIMEPGINIVGVNYHWACNKVRAQC